MAQRNSFLCSLALLIGLQLPGCGTAESATPVELDADGFPVGPYADRDPKLAKQLVDNGALLLDVRTPEEFSGRHLDGAVNIAHTQVRSRVAEIRKLQGGDLDKPIVVYCRSGSRSSMAKRELEAAGFTRVQNLGSIGDWRG